MTLDCSDPGPRAGVSSPERVPRGAGPACFQEVLFRSRFSIRSYSTAGYWPVSTPSGRF